jgi:hypothetical protein
VQAPRPAAQPDETELAARLLAGTGPDAGVGDFGALANLIEFWSAGEYETERQGVLAEAVLLNEFALKPGLQHFTVVFYNTIPAPDLDLVFDPASRFYGGLAEVSDAFAEEGASAAAACGVALNVAASFLHADKPAEARAVLDRAGETCAVASADSRASRRLALISEIAAQALSNAALFDAMLFADDAADGEGALDGWIAAVDESAGLDALAARDLEARGLTGLAALVRAAPHLDAAPPAPVLTAGAACPNQNAGVRRLCTLLHGRYDLARASERERIEAFLAEPPPDAACADGGAPLALLEAPGGGRDVLICTRDGALAATRLAD